MGRRFVSVCSGIEAASVAWIPLGWTCNWVAEIDQAASKVLAYRHPGVANRGDFTEIEAGHGAGPDVLVGGTPCFPAEVSVLTDKGLVSIADIKVGDLVLTHKGRYRKVLAAGTKKSETVILKGQGHFGLEVTEDHPFWSTNRRREWVVGSKKSGVPCHSVKFSDPEWVKAGDMQGKFWASPASFPELPIPKIEIFGNEQESVPFSEAFFWFVGAWIGDVWSTINNRRGYAMLCGAKNQSHSITLKLIESGLRFCCIEERTTRKFQVSSRPLARWLVDNFGSGAAGKSLPAWCLGMDRKFREALLDGYRFADGCRADNGSKFTTVSRKLAISIRLLATSLGQTTSVHLVVPSRTTIGAGKAIIEGREVNEKPFYQVVTSNKPKNSVEFGGWRFGLVRSITPAEEVKDVYNLEVEEDNSYTADAIVAHNCQDFSVAGLRLGLGGRRGGLTLEFLRLADRLRPRWIVWENVPGVLSIDRGRAFGAFLGGLEELRYGWAYRVLDAQYVGGCRLHGGWRTRGPVPQRRRRVFVVAYSGERRGVDGPASREDVQRFSRVSAAVLFERTGLLGNPEKGREAKPDVAPSVTPGARRASGARSGEQLTVSHTLLGEGFDGSPDGTGRGTPLVPVPFSWNQSGDTALGMSLSGCPPVRTKAVPAVMEGLSVRLLTPLECERLQGFPDDYTLVPSKKLFKPVARPTPKKLASLRKKGRLIEVDSQPYETASPARLAALHRLGRLDYIDGLPWELMADGPRYKMVGNSMSTFVMRWIGTRIDLVEELISEGRIIG